MYQHTRLNRNNSGFFQKFLKFVKYLYPKIQKPNNLMYAEKSIRPVTIIRCSNTVSNNKKIQKPLTKTNELSPSLYQNEKPEILNEIIAPTLIIHGQEDNIIPVISSQNLATYIPNTKLIIYPEIGHLPMHEAPKRVAKDIENFLSNF